MRLGTRGSGLGVRGERGVTLIEVTIVLITIAILAAAAAPVTSRTIDRGKLTRARSDCEAIKLGMNNLIAEFTSFVPFTITGTAGGTTVQMLVGDGDIPTLSATGDARWDDPTQNAAPAVDFFERHLVTNNPGGAGAYTTGGGTPWRGAYLNGPIDPDPWGNRYMSNVNWTRVTTTNDVVVLSAGPDEETDSAFAANGIVPGDDDVMVVARRSPAPNFQVP